MLIDGSTELIAHIGYPTHAFKAPMIYNPYFESERINAVVVPMACKPDDLADVVRSIFRLDNVRGALITMPHKVSVLAHLDEVTPAVEVAGACNAVKRSRGGKLVGDMFDGEGFVRGMQRKGMQVEGARALVVGCGGVGSAIAASLAAAGVRSIALHDVQGASADLLARRISQHFPRVDLRVGSNDPSGMDLVVNATPLGMNAGDAMPMDVARISPQAWVGEVVMKTEMTAFLAAAQARGCRVQIGTDMLFEMIPAYLEFFGFPTTSPDNLRSLARLQY
ncbi:shikimate dehydrogenase [Caenimonas sp. SL110]|uniref:shikimate dehydrogenase family protein n=1 Tax=Caenimonas sp. SL110 TaxID=1450524 RepID=UPI0006539020|nr:ThiF family adenylyltransferase [Caenimonas sp. SL110]